MTDPRELLEAGLSGRYPLERELGRGGMATVYLAQDLKHDRPVALKVLHPELAATLGPERFQREIRFAARLQHPHILSVYDSGEAAGQLWFTMPFVEGESLRDRLRREAAAPARGRAPHRPRGRPGARTTRTEHGVVHRDIKPENILLTRTATRWWPISGSRGRIGGGASESELTATGMSVGTPAYMSPEQASGDNRAGCPDRHLRLGCVLFEMLAGEPPFTGATPQSVIAKRFAGPAPSVAVLRDIPAWLDALVARALSRSPADRFTTATAFAKAIAAAATASGPSSEARTVAMAGGRDLSVASIGAAFAWPAYRAHRGRSAEIEGPADRDPHHPAVGRQRPLGLGVRAGVRASGVLPGDSTLAALWPTFSDTVTIRSEPEGAQVYWKRYSKPDAPGILLGTTPVPAARVPFRLSRIRLEKAAIPARSAMWPAFATRAPFVLRATPSPTRDGASRRRRDRGQSAGTRAHGKTPAGRLPHRPPRGDQPRVQAVRRHGGYRRRELWQHPSCSRVANCRGVTRWRASPTDGPSRPRGVGGRNLRRGAGRPSGDGRELVRGGGVRGVRRGRAADRLSLEPGGVHLGRRRHRAAEQLRRAGPGAGGRYRGAGPFGTFDMAGNAREWCLNQTGPERYVLGGGWNDQTYAFNDAYAQGPFDRSPTNGFRVVKYLSDGTCHRPAAHRRLFRDFTKERPVSDQVFAAYRRMYDYDRTKLNAVVDTSGEETDDWIRERVEFDAAYNGERMAPTCTCPSAARRLIRRS